jgi:hypothetical protein
MPTHARGPLLVALALTFVTGCHASQEAAPAAAPPLALSPAQPPAGSTTTTPVDRSVAVPQPKSTPTSQPATVLKSAPASIDLIVAGRKTSTTRKGVRTYPPGSAVVSDGRRQVAVEITRIDPKRFGDLTVADAASDGWASLAEYRAALLRSYPGLTDDDRVSVVHLRLANP